MMNKKQIILSLLAFQVVFLVWLHAQQEAQYTQYMYNTVIINPAYAGSRGLYSISSIYRNQWTGIEGAPETINLSVNAPIGYKGKVGLGFSFLKDKVGPADEVGVLADFSYTVWLSENMDLSFGIKGGIQTLGVDFSGLVFNPSDPDIISFNHLFPIIGTGIYLYSDKWYAGVSVPSLLQTKHYDDVAVATARERMNFYLIGGYVFDLGRTTKLKPAFLAKAVSGAPLVLDLSASFLFNDRFALGAAFRLDAAVSALAGFQVTDGIMLGYTYDYDTTGLARFNSGSHEIFLRFEFKNPRSKRMFNPRFF